MQGCRDMATAVQSQLAAAAEERRRGVGGAPAAAAPPTTGDVAALPPEPATGADLVRAVERCPGADAGLLTLTRTRDF